jgi:hypothetical protein
MKNGSISFLLKELVLHQRVLDGATHKKKNDANREAP